MLLCCGALWAALAAAPLRAQIRIVPRAKLDSLAHPATAAGGAEAMRFERTLIDAGHIGEDDVPPVFDRRIFVYTQLSDKEPTAILSLRGAVTASVRTDDDYPHAMGALRLKQRTVRFGRTDKVQSERIECLNAGDKPLTPVCDEGFAATGLSFACEPATLAPGTKGDLVVRFDPAKAPQPLRRTPLPVGGPDVPPSRRMLWIEFGETE